MFFIKRNRKKRNLRVMNQPFPAVITRELEKEEKKKKSSSCPGI